MDCTRETSITRDNVNVKMLHYTVICRSIREVTIPYYRQDGGDGHDSKE